MANNPFDPQLVQVKKTLDRGGLGTVNRGFGSLKTAPTRTRQAPAPEPAEWWPENLSELQDVDTTTDPPTINQLLLWNGTDWVPGDAPTPPGAPNDRRWKVGSGEVTIDEFSDGSIDGAWVMAAHASIPALPSLARPRYVEDADVLSVKYGPETGVGGSGTADGATARHHALVRPLSSIGGSLAVGDGIITAFTPLSRANASHRMSGLIFSTTDASGAGNQLYCRYWSGNVGIRSLTNWGGDTSVGTDVNGWLTGIFHYQRMVRLSATTWRYDISPDGVSWVLGTTASTWAFEPTHVGFAESNWNTATVSVTAYEFIRRVSGVA